MPEPKIVTMKRLAEIEAAAERYKGRGYPQEIPDLTYTLREAVELLRNEGGCRCKCSTHGYGCGVAEATCRLERLCARCKFIKEIDHG